MCNGKVGNFVIVKNRFISFENFENLPIPAPKFTISGVLTPKHYFIIMVEKIV